MTTAYSNLLGLALPVTGELSGTWGDTVNDYITKYLDDAIANAQVISGSQTAVTLSKTTGTALVAAGSGSTGSAQYALIRCTGNPASTLTITVSYSSLTNSQFSKTYLIFNSTSTNQSVVVQATTSSGTSTGVTITAGERALIAWNGTDFVKIATQSGTGEFVTVDTTNLEVTNIKAKDGTAAATIADSTGAITVSTLLNVDNLRLDGNTLSSTDSNGNVVLAPNGTGDVQLDADTVRVGDSAAAVTLTSNGAGALTVTTGGAADLILNTNSGTNSGSITIGNGTNGNITVATNGTGDFYVDADTVRIGDSNANATITTNGTGDLILNTNSGTNSGSITIEDGVNGNIIIAPNGTGQVQISNAALDLTTIEVTNIRAKDGTASMTLADSTGIITLSATAGTANGVLYLNGSRAVTSGSALTFDGAAFKVTQGNGTGVTAITVQGGESSGDYGIINVANGATTRGRLVAGAGEDFLRLDTAGGASTAFQILTGSSYTERVRVLSGGQVNIGGNFTSTNNTLQVTGNTAIGYTTAAPTTGLIVAGNVGIGTDSPGYKLVVVGSISAGQTDGTALLTPRGGFSTSASYTFYGNDTTGISNPAAGVLGFVTGGSERARIDASGTLILRQSSNAANTSVSFNTTVQDALTLDSSGNLSVGTTSALARITALADASAKNLGLIGRSSDNASTLDFWNNAGSTRYAFIYADAGGPQIGSVGALPITFNPNSTERVRITSGGNVGIGETNPSTVLHVKSSGNPTITLSGSDGAYTSIFSMVAAGGGSSKINANGGTNTLVLQTNSNDYVYLNSSGNLGLGVSPGTAFDIGGRGNSTNIQTRILTTNAAGSSTRFQTTVNADTGFVTFASDVGGNGSGRGFAFNVQANQAMTLDASGNLLVGTTSRLVNYGHEIVVNGTAGEPEGFVAIRGERTADGNLGALKFYNYSNSMGGIAARRSGADNSSALTFSTSNAGSDAERARITSGGDLLVGTTTSGGKLTVDINEAIAGGVAGLIAKPALSLTNAANYGYGVGMLFRAPLANGGAILNNAGIWGNWSSDNNAYLGFATYGSGALTERARITSGGYFKASNDASYVGIAAAYHELRTDATGDTVVISNSNGSQVGSNIVLTTARAAGTNALFVYATANAVNTLNIFNNGNITNTNGSYGTISDQRLKQDIVDAGSQWNDLKSIRFRKYRMKSDVAVNPDAPYLLGVVAQELEQVSPGLVDEHPDMETVEVTDEDGNVTQTQQPTGTTTKSVKSSILLMKAAVALQEAMARIEQLEAKVAALEAK